MSLVNFCALQSFYFYSTFRKLAKASESFLVVVIFSVFYNKFAFLFSKASVVHWIKCTSGKQKNTGSTPGPHIDFL